MTKLIEKYVILDASNNIIETAEDIKSHERKLRVYDRERMCTVITLHSGDKLFDLYAARECINALDEYVPPALEPEPEEEDDAVDGDENSSD